MKKNKSNETNCVATSLQSNEKSKELAARVCQKILDLARQAGEHGITINEAEELITDHKPSSVSPRFAELVRRGQLVRVLIGYGTPTTRFPRGVARYLFRYDEGTGRNVTIHWHPKFAPKGGGPPAQPRSQHEPSPDSDDGSGESEPTQAVYL